MTSAVALEGLSPAHYASLAQDSGIPDSVIAERGYHTATTQAALKRLGFADYQLSTPGLVLPLHGVLGDPVGYQVRPDRPRIKDGKPVKYETPAGMQMVLDVPPRARPLLGNPNLPLLVTEGVKKGDALAAHGLCAVALLGVWNFRGTNEDRGKLVLPDWQFIALNGRRVYVVFDSDVMVKPNVHAALAQLRSVLGRLGADVAFIYLPFGDNGAKQGADDFLAAGHSVDDLLALASPELRPLVDDQADGDDGHPYLETDGRIMLRKLLPTGDVTYQPLTNFTARIAQEVVEDDGSGEERLLFEIAARRGEGAHRFTIPASAYPAMQWPVTHIGASAVVNAGTATKDHVRVAVQLLSGDVPRHRVFTHSGWRELDGQWHYLHGGGGITAAGHAPDVEVRLEGNLGRLRLPAAPEGEALRAAVRTSLDLLALAPPAVSVPLLAAIYLAPLRPLLEPEAYDLVVWLLGESGTFKSELAALAQAHYGAFTRLTLPGTFQATANALEAMLFRAKDALFVVDDFHPEPDRQRAQAMAAVAGRLLRATGNGAGRQRMKADLSVRPDLPPRGLALATGELLPTGYSAVARLFQVPVSKGAVDQGLLTEAQARADAYPMALAGYLQWLAGRWEELRGQLPEWFRQNRAAASVGGHAREPGQVAHLYIGLALFLAFTEEAGVIDSEKRERLTKTAWSALLELAEEQRHERAAQHPVERFLALLADGLASRVVYLEGRPGDAPVDPLMWGWEVQVMHGADGGEEDVPRHRGNADLLGWVDDDWLYLFPDATWEYLASAARRADQLFPGNLRSLLKDLDDRSLIETGGAGGGEERRTKKVRRGKATLRVIKLRRTALRGWGDAVPGTCSPNPDQRAPSGNTSAPDLALADGPVPAVPAVPRNALPGALREPVGYRERRQEDGGVVAAATLGPLLLKEREQGEHREQEAAFVLGEGQKPVPATAAFREQMGGDREHNGDEWTWRPE